MIRQRATWRSINRSSRLEWRLEAQWILRLQERSQANQSRFSNEIQSGFNWKWASLVNRAMKFDRRTPGWGPLWSHELSPIRRFLHWESEICLMSAISNANESGRAILFAAARRDVARSLTASKPSLRKPLNPLYWLIGSWFLVEKARQLKFRKELELFPYMFRECSEKFLRKWEFELGWRPDGHTGYTDFEDEYL